MKDLAAEIEKEAERLGGGAMESLGALLTNAEGTIEGIRDAEYPTPGMKRVPRREDLLTLAAFALLALRRHDAAPHAPLDADPREPKRAPRAEPAMMQEGLPGVAK